MTLTRKQAIRNLNELVSYRPQEDQSKNQFSVEDWFEGGIYAEAVALQIQTASKKPVRFLAEVWEIIKSYAVGFDARDLVFKSKLFKTLTDPTMLTRSNLVPIIDANFKHLITEFKKGTRFVLPDDFGGLVVAELLGTYKISALEKKQETETEPSCRVKILGTLDLKAYLPIAREGEYEREVVYRYTSKNDEGYEEVISAGELLNVMSVFPKGTKGKEEYICVGRKDFFRGTETKVWAGEEEDY